MKTDLSPDTDISLLPRADLPVIWEDFRAKAEAMRATAETLTVTNITQKDEMALARKTRLTLREIRIAVESRRVELGESHLKEIKKVNSAANAIKEFIQPLESRLLHQEEFAERFEADRIVELTKSRNDEVRSIRPSVIVSTLGKMSESDYAALIVRLKAEASEIEEANRARIEAERRLAEQQVETQRLLKVQQLEARAEQERQNAIAEAKALEVCAAVKAQNEAEHAIRVIEKLRQDAERAALIEEKRIRDEEYAALEAQIAAVALDAARFAAIEEKRLRDIACAPDVEKLWDFACRIQGVKLPAVASREAQAVVEEVSHKFSEIASILKCFCRP